MALTYRPLKAWLKIPVNGMYFYRIRFKDFSEINYVDNDIISLAANDPKFYIVLDQTLEAYAYKNFYHINKFVKQNNIEKKLIFLSAHANVDREYKLWCKHNGELIRFKVLHFNGWLASTKRHFIDTGLNFNLEKTKWFCCLNHRPHHHRIASLIYLDYLNLINQGIVTGHDRNYEDRMEDMDEFNNYDNFVNEIMKKFSPQYTPIIGKQRSLTHKKLPLIYDLEDLGNSCQPFAINETIFNDCLINLVTETFYLNHWNYDSEMFITEKTIKAILSKQIFIIVGPRHFLKYLRSMGIQTFGNVIDESYDDEPDETRLFSAINALKSSMEKYTLTELSDLTRDIRFKNHKTYLKLKFNINLPQMILK